MSDNIKQLKKLASEWLAAYIVANVRRKSYSALHTYPAREIERKAEKAFANYVKLLNVEDCAVIVDFRGKKYSVYWGYQHGIYLNPILPTDKMFDKLRIQAALEGKDYIYPRWPD